MSCAYACLGCVVTDTGRVWRELTIRRSSAMHDAYNTARNALKYGEKTVDAYGKALEAIKRDLAEADATLEDMEAIVMMAEEDTQGENSIPPRSMFADWTGLSPNDEDHDAATGWPELLNRPAPPDLILTAARDAVYGEREESYGHPSINLERTAQMLTGTLRALGWTGPDLTPGHVALLMIDVKRARLVETPGHLDTIADIAGWAEAYARCSLRSLPPAAASESAPEPGPHDRRQWTWWNPGMST